MKFAKTFSASIKTLAFLTVASLAGCSADSGDQPEDSLGDATEVGIPGDLSDKAGRSYVQWCNDPRASVGTLCRQQGCSGDACFAQEPAAIAECRDEVRRICGSAVQPWFIVMKADGYYWPL